MIVRRISSQTRIIRHLYHLYNHYSSCMLIGIATGWTAGVRFPAGARDISLLHSFQTGSGAHPASYPMGTGSCFSGGKAAGAWSWPLTSIKCRGQEWWSYTSIPPYIFMVWCVIHREQGQLYVLPFCLSRPSVCMVILILRHSLNSKSSIFWDVTLCEDFTAFMELKPELPCSKESGI
jgi:hypothetical protein